MKTTPGDCCRRDVLGVQTRPVIHCTCLWFNWVEARGVLEPFPLTGGFWDAPSALGRVAYLNISLRTLTHSDACSMVKQILSWPFEPGSLAFGLNMHQFLTCTSSIQVELLLTL